MESNEKLAPGVIESLSPEIDMFEDKGLRDKVIRHRPVSFPPFPLSLRRTLWHDHQQSHDHRIVQEGQL